MGLIAPGRTSPSCSRWTISSATSPGTGIAVDVAALQPAWDDTVDDVLREATLARPNTGRRPVVVGAGFIPKPWATCWPRCSTCTARIRGRRGERGDARCPCGVAEVLDPEVPSSPSRISASCVTSRVDEDGHVEVVITPTYSGCPALEAIEASIVETLHAAGHDDVAVTAVLAPAWTTDWMSDEGRRKLLEYGIAPPGRATHSQRRSGARIARRPLPAVRLGDDA